MLWICDHIHTVSAQPYNGLPRPATVPARPRIGCRAWYNACLKVSPMRYPHTRTAPKRRELHLFSGFLRCADCGKAVTRSQSGKNVYYSCSTYKKRSRTACTMHSIKHNRLEAAVLFAIQYQVSTAVSYSEIVARINAAPLKKVNLIALMKKSEIRSATQSLSVFGYQSHDCYFYHVALLILLRLYIALFWFYLGV